MADINRLREQLAEILCEKKKRKKRKTERSEMYMKDRLDGMTYTAIAKKYGVSHQAVSKACARYRRRMEQEAYYGQA